MPQEKQPRFEKIFVGQREACDSAGLVQVRLAGGEVLSGTDVDAIARLVRLLRGS